MADISISNVDLQITQARWSKEPNRVLKITISVSEEGSLYSQEVSAEISLQDLAEELFPYVQAMQNRPSEDSEDTQTPSI